MKKQFLLCTALLFSTLPVKTQVPKKTIVEHFTNSRCSICASGNPGFYTNLNDQTNVLHLSVYPSAPYPACLLNQQSAPDNDARTNYYGVYGSTPRLVINGDVISTAADYSANSLFTPYLNQTSPVSIKISQTNYQNDSLHVAITLKTLASHSLNNQKLFVALVEDTVFYSSPNGETRHYDVFRKTLSGADGISVIIPSSAGDSATYTMRASANNIWNFSRIYALAVLQDDVTKSVTQSESISAKSNTIMELKNVEKSDALFVFTSRYNSDVIFIKHENASQELTFMLYDLTGRKMLVKSVRSGSETISCAGIASGLYLYTLQSQSRILKTGKLLLN